ncbi:transposase [Paraburkholderia sp. 22B1P]|uniref:transposase n=1 Tax=Paraburkholderia sp. 22B1P TaxID=3080498 RepID=UPI00208C5FD7|nr:transposase [Paraburkholderia sp. 22B1P]GJH33178.1 transposase [Paraburkholderia hospita]
MHFEELSNEEWSLVGPILTAQPRAGVLRRGRPRIRTRVVANAVLWVLTTGQSWSKLPAHYPSQPTCRCRFEAWRLDGKLAGMIRILSEMGRSFAYVPETSCVSKRPMPKRDDASIEERGMPRVIWKSQASWQASPAQQELTHELRPDTSSRAFWMGLAVKGARVIDERGYVVYVAADPVPGAMFRGWAEITQNGCRVARSGLIGPKYDAPDEAMQCALRWARRWIELHGVRFEFELLHRAAD